MAIGRAIFGRGLPPEPRKPNKDRREAQRCTGHFAGHQLFGQFGRFPLALPTAVQTSTLLSGIL